MGSENLKIDIHPNPIAFVQFHKGSTTENIVVIAKYLNGSYQLIRLFKDIQPDNHY